MREELPVQAREDRAPGSGADTLEQFKSQPLLRHDQATREQALCLVCRTPGHERAARTKGLCVDCCRHRLARRQTVEEFVAGHPRLGVPQPRLSFGRCLVEGEKRAIDFTHLHQRWLRDAAKGYTIERPASKTRTAQQDVVWLAYLSDYLRLRDDGGEHPGALTREDMTGFLVWLRARMPVKSRRALVVSATRRHVQFARRHLGQSGSAAAAVGGSFQLYSEDLPERTLRDPDEPGKALPPVVLAQLLDEDVLAPLGSKHLEYRIGFELIAHSGRRPGEICNLAADCLRYEEEPTPDGSKQRRPVLRYLREKPPSKWLSLPINQDAAELIEAQQRRLQTRFPNTKLGSSRCSRAASATRRGACR